MYTNFQYNSIHSIPIQYLSCYTNPTYINPIYCQYTPNFYIHPQNQEFLYIQPVKMNNQTEVQETQSNQANKKICPSEKQQKQIKKEKRNQNPYRNLLTNIVNQIFGFILCRKKSNLIFAKINTELTQNDDQFYDYVKKLKKILGCYYNLAKLKSIWFAQNLKQHDENHHRKLRIISKYFIQQKLIISFLTSQKLSKQLKYPLLKTRRILLSLLENKTQMSQIQNLMEILSTNKQSSNVTEHL